MNEHDPFNNDAGDDENFTVDGDLTGDLPLETEYIAKLTDIVKGESQAGNPMFVWTVEIIKQADNGDDKYMGWERKVYTALTEKAMWKLNQTLQAFGIGEVVDGRIKANFTKADAVGRQCLIKIEHGEYKGAPQADIADMSEHPEGAGYKPDVPGM